MATEPYTSSRIIVDVNDRVISPTLTVKQRAEFRALVHDYDPETDEPQASITVRIQMYERLPSGEYGPALTAEGFETRKKTFDARNNTLVDASDPENEETFGRVLAIREYVADWQAEQDKYPFKTMLQGNFFEWVRDNVPSIDGKHIRKHIAFANANGLFD